MAAQDEHLEESLVLQCKDAETGRPGELTVKEDNLLLTLYAIDEPQYGNWPKGKRRIVQLETAEYATLLDCFTGALSLHSSSAFRVRTQQTIPSKILIGYRPWEAHDKVRLFRFTFTGANSALFYTEHVESRFDLKEDQFIETKITDYGRLHVFRVRTSEGTIISVEVGLDRKSYVVIETERACDLGNILGLAYDILTFFEMSLGHRSKMYGITVGHLTEEQGSRQDAADPTCFNLRQYWPWVPREITHKGDVIFPVYTASERSQTEISLKKWIERRSAWNTAYGLANRYLSGSDVYGRDRLLRLMAWFEAIPNYQNKTGVSDKALQKLRRKIREQPEFADVITGLQSQWVDPKQDAAEHAKKRLSGALSLLQRYDLKERLAQAVYSVRTSFGQEVVPSWCELDCSIAAQMRDDAAHGSPGKFADNFAALERAIHAVELVCLLSMLIDLEVSAERLCKQHPLQAYRLLGRPPAYNGKAGEEGKASL